MVVHASLFGRDRLEVSVVRVDLLLGCEEVKTLEEVGNVAGSRLVRKTLTFTFSHHGDRMLLVFTEEIFESNTEDECDTKQRGQGREKLSAFEFGKQGSRKSGVLA